MLRKDKVSHEKEARDYHLDLSLTTVGLLSNEHEMLSKKHETLSKKHEILLKQCGTKLEMLSVQQKELSDHKTLLDTVNLHEAQLNRLVNKEAVTFQLPGYARKKKANNTFHSKPFYSHPGGYKMCINVDANGYGNGQGTHVSVFTKILEGCYNNQLRWPFVGTVTYELLNQLGDDNHHSIVHTFNASHDMRVGSTNTQYLLDDTLYFRVSVEVDSYKPWLLCTDLDSNRATENTDHVIFGFTEYSKHRANTTRTISYSSCHSFGGYRMCFIVYVNGHGGGEGTHVSVAIKLLEDHCDNQLHWPFLGTVTYELLNQLRDDNHHSIILTYDASHDMRVGSRKGSNKLTHSISWMIHCTSECQ